MAVGRWARFSLCTFAVLTFVAESFAYGLWLSDTEIILPYGFNIKNVATNQTQTINTEPFGNFAPLQLSADRQYLLLISTESYSQVWRYSSISKYVLHRLVDGNPTGSIIPMIIQPNSNNTKTEDTYLRYVSWSPVNNALVYVDRQNNLHYRSTAEAEGVQLTNTGAQVYNGVPDWVNEEEVLEDEKAVWWAPDGTKVVYGVYNDNKVEEVVLPTYGNWRTRGINSRGDPFMQYSAHDAIRYPKAGGENPMVTLWVAHIDGPGKKNTIRQSLLPPHHSLVKEESFFTAIAWQDNSTVVVNWSNRYQNVTAVSACSLAHSKSDCRGLFSISERHGWVDPKLKLVYNKYNQGPRLLTILPDSSSFRWRQIWLINTDTNTQTMLTSQSAEVTQILEWTEDDQIYYISTLPEDPGARHLFKLQLDQQDSSSPSCLTCNHTKMIPQLQHRKPCQFVSVSMSQSGSYYTMDCSGPDIPYSCLHRTQTNALLAILQDNLEYEEYYQELHDIEFMEAPVPGSSQKAQVIMYKPPGAAQSSKKLPLVVEVYGGPGSQMVNKAQKGNICSSLLLQKGVVCVSIDPRGSGYQGDAWRHSIYRNFGTLEVTDTIAVTKWLQDNLDFVDGNRTGIWGWSYGGYLSLSALTQDDENVFKCGASVAPVILWELYDTIYTERYMSTPEDNPDGYYNSSPLRRINKLKEKQFYLLHGTHDDNVHYKHSMLLSEALEENDILFRQQTYPDQDHGIAYYRRHLYHSLAHFFTEECFHLENSDN